MVLPSIPQTRRTARAALLATGIAAISPAGAQPPALVSVPAGETPSGAIGFGEPGAAYQPVTGATPLPVGGKQEAVTLVAANVPGPPTALYGGIYVFTQGCDSYGSVALRYKGPDNLAMIPMLSRTAVDAGGGTLLSFGSGAIVDATVTGGAGCNAQLARVPQ